MSVRRGAPHPFRRYSSDARGDVTQPCDAALARTSGGRDADVPATALRVTDGSCSLQRAREDVWR
jgi:hypothetical protein